MTAQSTLPRIAPGTSVQTIMLLVLAALVPAVAVYMSQFGPAILVNLAFSSLVALAFEAIALVLRRRPPGRYLGDGSALLTAWLLTLSMPPMVPWWITLLANGFAILLAKHAYGGLGSNPFNPAMVGYCAMLVSFPKELSQWSPPGLLAATRIDFATLLAYIFKGVMPIAGRIDAETMATPLDTLKTRLSGDTPMVDILQMPIFGNFAGQGGEWIALAYVAGGVFLLWRGIITWHMPLAFLAGLGIPAVVAHLADPLHHAPIPLHLLGGGTMLAAFFIVTDPVSGATTPRGKLIFAAGIGIFTWIIRVFGGYVDGIAFAVLLMNMAVPLIDALTQPRIFGAGRGARP